MFSYRDFVIHSSVPLADIKAYFEELGVTERSCKDKNVWEFEYLGLKIELKAGRNSVLKDLDLPRNTLTVSGNSALAGEFLTNFRFKFLSAGG